MRSTMRHSFLGAKAFAAFALAFSLVACEPPQRPAGVQVEEAWVRLPPIPGRPGAAYFTLRNIGPKAILTGIASPQADRIEFHDSRGGGGVMRMVPLADVPVPANGIVTFAPSGRHAMLFGIDPGLKPGGTMSLTFLLQDGRKIEAQAKLAPAGGEPPHAH